MSLKSFDKFCETLITAEPGSQKVILDERQRQTRTKLTMEALCIYAIASFANTAVMDKLYRWCDSYFAPMAFLAAVCYIYWILRCHFSGALFGINGTYLSKLTAGISTVWSFYFCMILFSDFAEEGGAFHDGMLSTQLVGIISIALYFVSAVATIILAKKTEKAEQPDEGKKD